MDNLMPPPRYEPPLQPVNGIVQPPVMPPENRPGRRTNLLEDIKSTLNILLRCRFSFYFRNPVNSVMLDVPDYHSRIKYPMDLNTIKKRLHNNYYWQASEAIYDFDLIFENCRMYNLEGSPVYNAGMVMKDAFYARIEALDFSKEEEIKPKDKRKRKANDNFDLPPVPTELPSTVPFHYPVNCNGRISSKYVSTPIPGVTPFRPPIPSFITPDPKISFMPMNPLFPMLKPWDRPMASSFRNPSENHTVPPPLLRPVVLPPPLTTAPVGPIHMPLSMLTSPPPAPPLPPKPKTPPVIVCYKSLDRLIEKSHCDHLLKSMVKQKRKEFTWAFNNAEYWRRYGPNKDYDHDREEKLDWRVLQDRLNSDNFESFDTFVSSVRKMFQNAMRCFTGDILVQAATKKSNEIFEKRLPKYRDLIAKAKEKARTLVASKKEDLEAAGNLSDPNNRLEAETDAERSNKDIKTDYTYASDSSE
ncbi:bromodomain-containing protein 2 [Drosophila eugracilis]|uniref:bromodomain-containing protein 2 n=1 Tax=Drosophila eugracilis TaxID=29029 RepID=UPI001BD9BB05|nr:bromodomain-containing protein 2 [Drosophila eugracilis]